MLVRLAGFEPTTPWFVAKYSIQLSYSREARNYSSRPLVTPRRAAALVSSGGAAPHRPRCAASSASAIQALRRAAAAQRRRRRAACSSSAPRLAPQLALGERAAGGAERRRRRAAARARPTPGAAATRRRCRRRAGQRLGDGGALLGAELGDPVPERAQPGARLVGGAERARGSAARAAMNGSRRSAGSKRSPERGAAGRGRAPCRATRRRASAAGRARRPREKPWCLTSRRAVFSASCGWRPRRAACSFRRSAWVRRATPSGSSASSSQRARRVAIVERPFGGEQARALLGRARRRAALRRARARGAAPRRARAVLQAMRAAGGEQVAEHGELVVLRQLGRLGLDRERALRRLLGAAVAAAEVLRQRVAQRRLAGAVAPRGAPLARALRQADERVHAPGSRRRSGSRCRSAAAGTG